MPQLEHPATPSQRALWNIWHADPQVKAYHAAISMRMPGLEPERLLQAFDRAAERHPALRTLFVRRGGELFQQVQPHLPPQRSLTDARACSPGELREAVDRACAEPFDLEHGSPLRISLFREKENDHILLMTAHHIALDGRSAWLLLEEVMGDYGGRETQPAPPEYDMIDFSRWQRSLLQSDEGGRLEDFWREQLRGVPAALTFPEDRPRPPRHRYRGDALPVTLGPGRTGRLRETARRLDLTLYALLLSAWQVLLARYSGQDEVLVGSPASGRTLEEHDRVIGYLVNMLVLRGEMGDNLPFQDFAGRTAENIRQALARQDYPFPLMVSQAEVEADRSRHPLFQAEFGLQQSPGHDDMLRLYVSQQTGRPISIAGVPLEAYHTRQQEGQFDLALDMVDLEEQLCGTLRYNADVYEKRSMERLSGRYLRLLDAICEDPGQGVYDLPLAGPEEQEELAARSLPRREPRLPAASLPGWFDRTAGLHPDATAVDDGRTRLTYRELQQASTELAGRILAAREEGNHRSPYVGVCMGRTAHLPVALLGVLRAGCAYLPLDPVNPDERLEDMLRDAGAELLLTDGARSPRLEGTEVQRLLADRTGGRKKGRRETPRRPMPEPDAESTAYLIYTSGSTGRPKGTKVSHGNVMRLFTAAESVFGFGPADRWMLFHSYAFDFSVWEMWGALLYGGRLCLPGEEVLRSPEALARYVERRGITVLNQTPTSFYGLLGELGGADAPSFSALEWVIFGGEALNTSALRPWFERYGDSRPHLVNMYGITETTVHVTWHRLRREDAEGHDSPIGEPLPDLGLCLRDRRGVLVPDGMPGELYVSGAGVSQGYLNREELNARRFLTDDSGLRWYRTGDLARRRPDGGLVYLGRSDEQLKIRGYRIEPGEIDRALCRHPGVRASLTKALPSPSGRRLVAWCVAGGSGMPDETELKAWLRGRLPDYMIPAKLLFVDRMPLTANGKIDAGALPRPAFEAPAGTLKGPGGQDDALEAGDLRAGVAAVCSRILQREEIPYDRNFFDLGADSISINLIYRELKERLDGRIGIVDLYEHPTVSRLCARLEDAGSPEADRQESREKGDRQAGRSRRAAMSRRRRGRS